MRKNNFPKKYLILIGFQPVGLKRKPVRQHGHYVECVTSKSDFATAISFFFLTSLGRLQHELVGYSDYVDQSLSLITNRSVQWDKDPVHLLFWSYLWRMFSGTVSSQPDGTFVLPADPSHLEGWHTTLEWRLKQCDLLIKHPIKKPVNSNLRGQRQLP